MKQYTRDRLKLLENGYSPIRNRDKRTFMRDWTSAEITEETILSWDRSTRDTATGMRVENGLAVIDFDTDDKDAMDEIADTVCERIPELGQAYNRRKLVIRQGKGAKEAWFCRTSEEFGRIHSRAFTKSDETVDDGTHRVEIFGGASPRQFGCAGPHTVDDDGTVKVEYRYPEASLLDTKKSELPELTKQQCFQIADIVEDVLTRRGWSPVERSSKGENDATRVYDLTDDMTFDMQNGDTLTLDQLRTAAKAHEHGLRCSASWLEGPQAVNRTRCLVTVTRTGNLAIWESAAGVTHLEAELKPCDLSEGIRERLRKLQVSAASSGIAVATGEEAERLAYNKLVDAEVEKLSRLAQKEYQRARTPASRRLGINLRTLDSMVRTTRKARTDKAARADAARHGRALTCDDFAADMQTHQYIHKPTGALWPAPSVNARVPPVEVKDGDATPASEWLDRNSPVDQRTWLPGEPEIIRDELIDEGGRRPHKGAAVFNVYKPAVCKSVSGDPGPWRNHVHLVYPEDAPHIISWMAHRVQRPAEKINHALLLGGKPGIGKDTILEPVRQAVGPWNVADIKPDELFGQFNSFARSVLAVISEIHDLGDANRFSFYERTKRYIVAPPEVLTVNEKHLRPYNVPNVCGVVLTTNHKTDGLFLPPDDRRHYVAWSPLMENPRPAAYFDELYRWYTQECGFEIVADHLRTLDISAFNPKKPPLKTGAFWEIVHASSNPEDAELVDALEGLGDKDAVIISDLMQHRVGRELGDLASRRKVPHRMGAVGYVIVRNPAAKDGLWKLNGKRQAIYGREAATPAARLQAAQARAKEPEVGGGK
ncbi:hypothetical protein D8676_24040 [Mesorhizobium sp. YM1C-6-2]|nr:hypothetical protein D8676_24040 [Mesorhizobium sp. YM1C-6-2]